MTNPVINTAPFWARGVPTPPPSLTSLELPEMELARETAVKALAAALQCRWPNTTDTDTLDRSAKSAVEQVLELGSAPWCLLSPDSAMDVQALAAAVLATAPDHDGSPPSLTDEDCARQVLTTMVERPAPWAAGDVPSLQS